VSPGRVASPSQPAAFMSYAQKDDKHDFNQLSLFRERLSGEVQVQTAMESFDIFHDRTSVSWGENWKQRVDEALDSTTFLLVFLTPNFFASKECKREVRRFLEREKQLGRKDLILPVYYISADQVDLREQYKTDRLISTLNKRKYFDWREYRFEPFDAPLTRKAMATLAEQMRASFFSSVASV
jgi:F-box protein 11